MLSERVRRVVLALSLVGLFTVMLAAPAASEVSNVRALATPDSASSLARYEIMFTTTMNVPAWGTVTVTFPSEARLPPAMDLLSVLLRDSEGALVPDPNRDPDPIVDRNEVTVTVLVPVGSTLKAGSCTLVIQQSAGIRNPSIGSKVDYKLRVRTSMENLGAGQEATLVIKPTFSLSTSEGPRRTPVTVIGKGWTPNTGVVIGGALSGTGSILGDGTFSVQATPQGSGEVTVVDGSGHDAAVYWGIAPSVFSLGPTVTISTPAPTPTATLRPTPTPALTPAPTPGATVAPTPPPTQSPTAAPSPATTPAPTPVPTATPVSTPTPTAAPGGAAPLNPWVIIGPVVAILAILAAALAYYLLRPRVAHSD